MGLLPNGVRCHDDKAHTIPALSLSCQRSYPAVLLDVPFYCLSAHPTFGGDYGS